VRQDRCVDLGLRDQVVVVGGGSRGLGYATAAVLVAEGARVVLAGRDLSSLRAAAQALGPAVADGVATDLADPASAGLLVDAALARFGRLDGALLNVGGPPRSTAMGTDDDAWTVAFASVFLGPARLARAVAAHLVSERGTGGALCFVLSSSARAPIPELALSNGLRPGLAGHVQDLAGELGGGPRPVRVTAVLPGRIATDRLREGAPDAASWAALRDGVPLGRVGEPAELGRVAAFLLSPAASYVTGALVSVDGGLVRGL